MDDDPRAMDAKRSSRSDDKTFDSLAKLSVTSTGRRRLLQAAGAVGIGSLLTRGAAAAGEVVAQACQNRGTRCQRNRQCDRNDSVCVQT
jgi:hypothetical protein